MRLIWYNRDEFSDRDIAQAKAVANRLHDIKKNLSSTSDYFFSGEMIRPPFQWSHAPQWAKDAKEKDERNSK